MSTVSATNASDASYVKSSSSDSSNLDVDVETFLQLMVAQMQYQDPLEPQTDIDFLAQLAQLTATETMQEMNESVNLSTVYNMIGKYVYAVAEDEDTGEDVKYLGLVDSVINSSGSTYAVIGEKAVSTDYVIQVFDSSCVDTGSFEEYVNYLGKYIDAVYEDSDGNAVSVSGICKSMYEAEDGLIYLQLLDSDTGELEDVPGVYVLGIKDQSSDSTEETTDDTTDDTTDEG